MAFKLPKDLIGHYATILVHGIAAFEIKITEITEEEVQGTYSDGEEVHIRQEAILVYWPNKARATKEKERSERMKKIRARKKEKDKTGQD